MRSGCAVFILMLLPFVGRAQQGASSLVVQGAVVVFFEPTKAEGDSITQSEGIDNAAMLDDYDLASGKTAVYLSRKKIPYQFTTSQTIFVKLSNGKVRRFDRKAIPDLVGMILSDGVKEPRLVSGSAAEQALIFQINDFFRIPGPAPGDATESP